MARVTASARIATRARLLEAAASRFARDGLDGASIDAVSLDAGFAKGTVYNYFPSKDALFAEVIAEGCRRAVERYRQATHGGTVRERLLALAAADVAVLRENEPFHKVMFREVLAFRPETYPLIVEHLAPFVEQVQSILVDGVVEGSVRGDRPVGQLALLFTGLLALLYVQHWGSRGAWPSLDEIPALAVTSFLDGAAARSAAPQRRSR